ncbi:MAG: hypothetical protein HGB11_07420 [Chlorobiales bacterium]|nr:hypothetical protein [Chlorobiales bacterium]
MSYNFTKKDFKKISAALGAPEPTMVGNAAHFEILYEFKQRKLTLEIYPEIQIGDKHGNLVSVYTPVGLMQLHFCTNFIASEELGEVILFAETKDKLSGFIISKDAGLTCYSNVDKDLLSKDPFKLCGEVLGCAIQLSLTEHKLEEIK